jgi:glycerol-3-phosphate acyltransferase PlsY
MFAIAVKVFVAYLLGSLNGSLLLGRLIGVDIRQEGSGNAGGTNALRTHGKFFALGVVLIDVLKAVAAAGWLPRLGAGSGDALPWVQVACGAAAVIGHCYPMYFGFRGGKGMATLIGVYAVLSPVVLMVVVLTWLACMMLFGYVGIATMAGAAAAPVYTVLTGQGMNSPILLFSLAMALLIIYTHRSNLARLRSGTEHRMFRALLTRRH